MATILREPYVQPSKHPARAGYPNPNTSQSVPEVLRPVGKPTTNPAWVPFQHPALYKYLNADTSQNVPQTLLPLGVVNPARRGVDFPQQIKHPGKWLNPYTGTSGIPDTLRPVSTPPPTKGSAATELVHNWNVADTSQGVPKTLLTIVVNNPPIRTNHLNQPIVRPLWINADTSEGIPKVLYQDEQYAPAYLELQRVLPRPVLPLDTSQSVPNTLKGVVPSPFVAPVSLTSIQRLWQGLLVSTNDTYKLYLSSIITGTSSTTNANDFTSSASGTTTILGTLARTNADDTSAASGTTTVTGTLNTTNANDTSNASGSVGNSVSGTSSTTNANDTSAASGSPVIVGTSTTTNANDTSATQGTTTIVGTLAKTNNNDTVSASGSSGTPPVGGQPKLPMTGVGT